MTDATHIPDAAIVIVERTGERLFKVSREWTNGERIDRAFDAWDSKGRRFGAMVRFGTETNTANPASGICDSFVGTKISAKPHATRDGKPYGALQPTQRFDTMEDARAWAVRYMIGAEKRAMTNKARAPRPASTPGQSPTTEGTTEMTNSTSLPELDAFFITGATPTPDVTMPSRKARRMARTPAPLQALADLGIVGGGIPKPAKASRTKAAKPAAAPKEPAAPRVTKAAQAQEMLEREGGASVAEIMTAMGWLPHTTRAFLSGLRKKGLGLAKADHAERGMTYTITKAG